MRVSRGGGGGEALGTQDKPAGWHNYDLRHGICRHFQCDAGRSTVGGAHLTFTTQVRLACADRPPARVELDGYASLPSAGPDGLPTTQKLWDTITGNLVIANYNSMAALGAWLLGVDMRVDRVAPCLAYASADHDDASAYYNCSNNVFSYSPFGLVRLDSLFNRVC